MSNKKIVFTGGGTAGHIFPIVAVTREIRKIYPGEELELFYLGPEHEHGSVLLSQEGVKVKNIISGKLRRYFSLKNFTDFFKVPIGIAQSFFWLFWLSPDIIFSKGGYGSLPVVVAARVLSVPLLLQESDSVPGLASKITAKAALEIFTAFPSTNFLPKQKVICVGNPIRTELLEGNKEKAKEILKLQGDKPLILILGGSQGSQSINNLILEILPQLTSQFEIVHQTGIKNQKEVESGAEFLLSGPNRNYYHPFAFLNDEQLKHILVACDFVISRAGAGAIFEIAAARKPSLLIPLPGSAQNHQVKNAYIYKENGCCDVIEEENLKPNFFFQKLESLMADKETLKVMAENAANFSRPKAAQAIANYLVEYLYPTL